MTMQSKISILVKFKEAVFATKTRDYSEDDGCIIGCGAVCMARWNCSAFNMDRGVCCTAETENDLDIDFSKWTKLERIYWRN